MNDNEARARILINTQLTDQGWNIHDANAVRYEVALADGGFADYVLYDRRGRPLAVIEAKRFSIDPRFAAAQARRYAQQLGVAYVFLANGRETQFWEWQAEAHPRPVKTFFKQDDLERRAATLQLRRNPQDVPTDTRIAGRYYQIACIDALCREIGLGRRKLLVEMATGTGKTRTAAAFIKRLFEAHCITRVLFLVDRNPLAIQTIDALTEHLPDYPAYVQRSGQRFQDEKNITVTTLQSMVNIYRDYSPGYFDLIISDECHRSIYGKWSGVLKYFDGIQLGLTATPCVAPAADPGDDEDQLFVRDTLRFFEVDQPTYSYTLKQAIADGHLAPYQIYRAKTVLTAAEGGFPVKRDELDWHGMDADTRAELELLFGTEDTIVVDPSALERRFTIPERNRAIVREFRQVYDNGYMDGAGVLRKPLLGKTIVFAVTKRHAATLAEMFDHAFADLKPDPATRYADYVVSDLGPDDEADAYTKIRRFKKDKFPQILVSVNMLDTGFDCPEIVNLVFARFTRSSILYQQMRGRGTRKPPGKPIFTLFDFVGVTDLHGDADTWGEGGVVTEPARKRYQPRGLIGLDIHDQIDPASRGWMTLDEDGKLVIPGAVEARAAELGARFEAWLLRQTGLDAEQERWLALLGNQIRANADSLDALQPEHFACFHVFEQLGGLPGALRIFGGPAPLDALLASLNAALFGTDDGSPPRPGDAPAANR